jgi:hypothetical protein
VRTFLLALWWATSVYSFCTAKESSHAVTVDMPEIITLAHASPETWYTLLALPLIDHCTLTAAADLGTPSLSVAAYRGG